MANAKLSKLSVYEQMFKTRHRSAGRPNSGEGSGIDSEPMFPVGNRNAAVVRIAMRRAYAVVHEENKARMREVFAAEVKVLSARPLVQVLEDAGMQNVASDGSE